MCRNKIIWLISAFFLIDSMPSIAIEPENTRPFQLAAETVSRGFQAFRLKQEGVKEDVVRDGLNFVPGSGAEPILLSVTVDEIYKSTVLDARSAIHRMPGILLGIAMTKYGAPESTVEIKYEQCLKSHDSGLEFSTSLYNQTKSALDRSHSSKYARIYAAYLEVYYSVAARAKQEISDSIIDEYLSCYSSISDN